MALLIVGMKCFICDKPITDAREAGGFPPFVENELDPLFVFNDSVFHQHCLERHPSGCQAMDRYREFAAANTPGVALCTLCGGAIVSPDEFFGLARLTGDTAHPFHRLNYAKMHKSCLERWELLGELLQFLQMERLAGKSSGRAIDHMIGVLQRAQKVPP